MATLSKLTATIAAGQFLSNTVDLAGNFVVGLIMPLAWTPARVSILIAVDDINFHDLFRFGDDGTTAGELKFNVTPNAIISINSDAMLMARYLKLRSGTRDEPVVQEAERVFGVITVNRVTVVEELPAVEPIK